MLYYKAKITNIRQKQSEKVGSYICLQFTYQTDEGSKKAYKNFFVNHPKKETSDKSRQMLYKMKQKKTETPQTADNSVMLDSDVMISIIEQDGFCNVHTVYFIA